MDVGDTHKTLTPVVSAMSGFNTNEPDGGSGSGSTDSTKEDEDRRNCTSLPLCYDRVSTFILFFFYVCNRFVV